MSITASLLSTLPTSVVPPAVDIDSLPSAQSADLVLVPGSGLEYVQTAYLNGAEWKGPLTIKQYLEREVQLQAVGLTTDGRITGWILTSNTLPTNPDGTRPILASCESIPIAAYVARNGELQKVRAHGIASVYTRPEHRRRGYAGRMMVELGKKLESWQQIDGQPNPFSILFSDIGQEFYAQYGWKPFRSTHIRLAPLLSVDYAKAALSFPAIQDLSASDLQELPATHFIKDELRRVSAQDPGATFVAIDPDIDHFQWHHTREEYQARVLERDWPAAKGAIHRDTGLAVVWCRKYATHAMDWALNILHTAIPSGLEISEEHQRGMAALLLRAQVEASKWDMAAGVEIWDPSDLVLAAAQLLRAPGGSKVEVLTRDKEHLCSLRWADSGAENPVWIAKQKYAWSTLR